MKHAALAGILLAVMAIEFSKSTNDPIMAIWMFIWIVFGFLNGAIACSIMK